VGYSFTDENFAQAVQVLFSPAFDQYQFPASQQGPENPGHGAVKGE
jgi:hypothetical protein